MRRACASSRPMSRASLAKNHAASVQAMADLSRHEKALALAEAAVGAALVDVNEASSAAQPDAASPVELRLYMESCEKLFSALEPFDPGYARLQRAIVRSYAALEATPARANWIDLREALGRAASDLEIRRGVLATQRDALTTAYQRSYDAVTVETMLLSIVGLVAFGERTFVVVATHAPERHTCVPAHTLPQPPEASSRPRTTTSWPIAIWRPRPRWARPATPGTSSATGPVPVTSAVTTWPTGGRRTGGASGRAPTRTWAG